MHTLSESIVGKSSLLAAILGEMWESGLEDKEAPGAVAGGWNVEKPSRCVTVCGRLAYVPQQAWILNATVRENILFGLPYDAARFNAVMEACCLDTDMRSLPAREFTEIGQKLSFFLTSYLCGSDLN